MMEREGRAREEREYRRLLEGRVRQAEVEDSAMGGVGGNEEGDANVQTVDDLCRMRHRAIDKVQTLRLEELGKESRERLEELEIDRDELEKQTELRAQALQKQRKNLAELQKQNAHEQVVTSERKKLQLAELEYMKAPRQQSLGSRYSWTAEQWALEARVCQRLDRGYARVSRWLEWEEIAKRAREQGDPRHHNNIIVELAEGYFFRTKGERNFYEEKANLKPDLLREPMKLQPKTHEEELRKKKTRKHNPHQPGRALRAQLAMREAKTTAEATTEKMLGFGPDWGRVELEMKENEEMETDQNVELDRDEQVKLHEELQRQINLEAKEQFAATRELELLARSTWNAGQWAREVERLKKLDTGNRDYNRARWQRWEDRARQLHDTGDARHFNQILVDLGEKHYNAQEVSLLFKAKFAARREGNKKHGVRKERQSRTRKRLEKDNAVEKATPNMLDFLKDPGLVNAEQRVDENMGGAESEPEKFVVEEEGVIDLTG